MKNKSKSGVRILITIIILVGILTVLSFITGKKDIRKPVESNGNPNGLALHMDKQEKSQLSHVQKKAYIAAIHIEGTIEAANSTYNQKWIMSTIDDLKYDENNVAIALYIDSPGGGVYQADEVYLSLMDYKKTGKKVYAYMGPLAASGGYYISCAADKIYANRNTLTGSIGVISGQVFDITELLYNLGIESTTIYTGDNKNMGNFNEPFTEEQQDIMQEISDECYEQFLSIVVDSRKIPEATARRLADGRIYTANQALNHGLIDEISTWDNMIETLSQETINSSYCRVVTYEYEKKLTFMEELLTTVTNIKPGKAASGTTLPMYMYQK